MKDEQSWLESVYRQTYDLLSIDAREVLSACRVSMGPAERDALAEGYIRSAAMACGAAGVVTGSGGLLTLPIAVPADVGALAANLVRLAQRMSLVYGADFRGPGDEARMWVLFAGALGVDVLQDAGLRAAVSQAQRYALRTPFTRSLLLRIVRRIGVMLGVRLTHRSIAQLVPVLGGLVGGGMNYSLVRSAGQHLKARYRELHGAAS